MGYEHQTLRKLLTVCKEIFGIFVGARMLELGDQVVYNTHLAIPYFMEHGYFSSNSVAKYFFEHLGFKYLSIDYNGRNGALPLDVRRDLTKEVSERFDVLTNLGFTEHVGEGRPESELRASQYAVFKNLHDLGTENALYYHTVPMFGYWFKHGVCDYTLEFFAELCKANNYQIVREPYVEDYHPEKQVSVFYRKNGNTPFISFEAFCALPGLRSTHND